MAKRNIQKRLREEEGTRSGSNGVTPSFYYGNPKRRREEGRAYAAVRRAILQGLDFRR